MATSTRNSFSPQALHRNRRLFIAGVLIVLPAAAFAPFLLPEDSSPPLLAAVEVMTTSQKPARVEHRNFISEERSASAVLAARHSSSTAPLFVSNNAPAIDDQPVAGPAKSTKNSIEQPADSIPGVRTFNGRPVRVVRTISMLVTAYSPDARSCGDSADGITASGYSVWTNGMKMVAADTNLLPFGTLVTVPGYDDDHLVPVLDRGGAIKGKRLDVLFPTHERAMQWGAQRLEVTVWEYADGQPADFQLAHR